MKSSINSEQSIVSIFCPAADLKRMQTLAMARKIISFAVIAFRFELTENPKVLLHFQSKSSRATFRPSYVQKTTTIYLCVFQTRLNDVNGQWCDLPKVKSTELTDDTITIPFQNDGNVFTIYVSNLNGASHSSNFFSGSLSFNTLLHIADLLNPRPLLVGPRIARRRQGWNKFVI